MSLPPIGLRESLGGGGTEAAPWRRGLVTEWVRPLQGFSTALCDAVTRSPNNHISPCLRQAPGRFVHRRVQLPPSSNGDALCPNCEGLLGCFGDCAAVCPRAGDRFAKVFYEAAPRHRTDVPQRHRCLLQPRLVSDGFSVTVSIGLLVEGVGCVQVYGRRHVPF